LPLPPVNWHIVLDGLDESEVDLASLRPLLGDLRNFGTLLVSCRELDFDEKFYPLHETFERIIRLLPWGNDEVDSFCDGLQANGRTSAVQYLEHHRNDYGSVLSLPLWLTMVTSLCGRDGEAGVADEVSDYAFLSECSSAFAKGELERHRRDAPLDEPLLLRAWQAAAWQIHKARRRGGMLGEQSFRDLIGMSGDQIWSACRSLLDERNGIVHGFIDEALFEHWLAGYVVSRAITPGIAPDLLAEALSFQRSIKVNQLIRQGVSFSDKVGEAAAALREAFWHTDAKCTDGREVFAKNQIVYLLGEIDDSAATRRFLLAIWSNKTEVSFVRYSAGNAAASLGAHSVEEEFYDELKANDWFDRMNRWSQRFYYGDLQADEKDGLNFDDESGSAERAVRHLIERLWTDQARHINLRRIDLFTIRRFMETREISLESLHLEGALKRVEEEIHRSRATTRYANSVLQEIRQIRAL
jgi:hypothetical protein